jgi:hypothetical protein
MSGALGLFHIPHLWDMYRFRASTAFRKSTLHGLFTARVCEGLCFLLLGLHSVLRIFYHVYKRRNGLKGTSILHRIRGLCRNTCFWFTSLSRFLRLTGFSGMFPPCHNSVSESNFPVAYHLCPAEGFTGGHLEHYLRHHLSHFSITLPNHCDAGRWGRRGSGSRPSRMLSGLQSRMEMMKNLRRRIWTSSATFVLWGLVKLVTS